MPNIVGYGNTQVPTNAMLGDLAYQDSVDVEVIPKIKAKINEAASNGKNTVFVYDTSKDSDGGAWRKRTKHTSWYNEPPSSTRGTRKEFPSIAIIVGTNNYIDIYDADDPLCALWMRFIAGTGGHSNCTMVQNASTPHKVCMLNGILIEGSTTGSDNWGNAIINFISEEVVRADPQTGEGGYWTGNISQRNQTTGSGYTNEGKGPRISNSRIRSLAMKVLPDARINRVTGLPQPTLAYGHYSGYSIVTAKTDSYMSPYTNVYDITASSYSIGNFINFTENSNLIFEQDGSNGRSVFFIPVPTADRTTTTNDGSIQDKVILKPYRSGNRDYARFNEPYGTNEGITDGQPMKGDAFALLSFGTNNPGDSGHVTLVEPAESVRDYSVAGSRMTYGEDTKHTMAAFITRDFNTGWMIGGNRSCFMASSVKEVDGINYALQATAGATNRLTSTNYTSGATTFTLVDNASSNNGYQVIELKGLTVGQTYKISMTRSAHTPLDSGYAHRVTHDNSGSNENSTEFTGGNWNLSKTTAHGVVGYFTAQTANSDDLIIYANATTITHSNLSITETNSLGEGMTTSDLFNGAGAFSSSSGWQNASGSGGDWTVTGGYAQGGSGNNSIYKTVYNLIPGRTYCVSCNVLQLHNNSTLFFYIPHAYGQHPIQHTGLAFGYFVADSTSENIGVTNLAGTNNRIDDLKLRLVDEDRTAGNSGIFAYGEIDRVPVAKGAELAAYYFGANDNWYLYQGYNPELDFTNEMSIMFWVKDWNSSESLLHRGPDTTRYNSTSFLLYCDGGNDLRFTVTSNGSTEQNTEIQMPRDATGWNHVCFTKLNNSIKGYLNGVHMVNNTTSGNIYSQSSVKNGLYIGRGPIANNFTGSMALLKISSTAPTESEVAKIYADERAMFGENAKCTIYGSSDDVKAIGYDSEEEILHMGTIAGRSDFSGLVRINNTTKSVSTVISASNGVIAEQ